MLKYVIGDEVVIANAGDSNGSLEYVGRVGEIGVVSELGAGVQFRVGYKVRFRDGVVLTWSFGELLLATEMVKAIYE